MSEQIHLKSNDGTWCGSSNGEIIEDVYPVTCESCRESLRQEAKKWLHGTAVFRVPPAHFDYDFRTNDPESLTPAGDGNYFCTVFIAEDERCYNNSDDNLRRILLKDYLKLESFHSIIPLHLRN